jgi:hypothetical protein
MYKQLLDIPSSHTKVGNSDGLGVGELARQNLVSRLLLNVQESV